jgi:protein required for attachment to host cells
VSLPGWDNLGTVQRLARGFTIAGFVSLFFLLAFEILGYLYGNRKDDLVAIAENRRTAELRERESRSNQQRDEQIRAAEERSRQTAEEQKQQAEQAHEAQRKAEARVSELEVHAAPRHLTDLRRERMHAALANTAKYDVVINRLMGDSESDEYAREFALVLRDAGWNPELSTSVYRETPKGILIAISTPNEVPAAAAALVTALDAADLHFSRVVTPDVPSGRVELIIGVKPVAQQH